MKAVTGAATYEAKGLRGAFWPSNLCIDLSGILDKMMGFNGAAGATKPT